MFRNLKWYLNKNNPDKLFSMYSQDDVLKPYIIDKLIEYEEINYLLEIAKLDRQFRSNIVMQLIEDKKLDLSHIDKLLRWLPFSQLYEKVLNYVHKQFPQKSIEKLKEKFKLQSSRNISKKLVLNDFSIDSNLLIDEDYIKLKELIKGMNFEHKPITSSNSPEQTNSAFIDFLNYQFEQKNILSDYEILKNSLIPLLKFDEINKEILFSLFNLSRLDIEQKIKLIDELNDSRLFYPECYLPLTDFYFIPLKDIQKYFSIPIVIDWVNKFIQSHWLPDVYDFIEHNEKDFGWIEDEIKQFSKYRNIAKISKKNRFFKETAYTLNNIISNEALVKKLNNRVESIIQNINKSSGGDNKEFNKQVDILYEIGGNKSFKFINSLLNRIIVKDYDAAINNIEAKYKHKKENLDSNKHIADIINEEVIAKNKLLPKIKYQYVLAKFFNIIVNKRFVHPQLRKELSEHLPDLVTMYHTSNQDDKIKILKIIAILEIKKYEEFITERTLNESNELLKIHAAMGMLNLKLEKAEIYFMKIFEDYSGSKYQLLSNNLYYLKKINKNILIDLATNCPNCISTTLKVIEKFPIEKAIQYYYEIVNHSDHINSIALIHSLKKFQSPQIIPLIIELMKSGGFHNKIEFVRSLGKIDSPESIKILENIKYKDKLIIGIERARALIRLDQSVGWEIIKKYMHFNIEFIQKYAKIAFIKHSNSSHIHHINILLKDESPLVSIYAIAKLSLYNENQTWKFVAQIISSKNNELKYLLSVFLSYFPINKTKKYIVSLYKNSNYDSKLGCALIMLKINNYQYYNEILENVDNLSKQQKIDLIKSAKVFKQKEILPILKKILLTQEHAVMEDAIEIFNEVDQSEFANFGYELWKQGDNKTKEIVSHILYKVYDPTLLPFLKKEIENNEYSSIIKAHFAQALINNGQESGWDYLEKMINSEENYSTQRNAIKVIAEIGNQRSVDILSKKIKTNNDALRAEIIKGFAKIGDLESFNIIKKYTKDNSAKVLIAVAKVLGNLFYPEAETILKEMLSNHNGYVKVAAEVSLQKLNVGFTPKYDIRENMEEVLKSPEWKLNLKIQKNKVNSFIDEFKKKSYVKLDDFETKIIMEADDIKRKINQLDKELAETINNTDDIDKIKLAKIAFNEKISKYATIADLLNSILHFEMDNSSEKQINLLKATIDSGNILVVRALTIHSIKSKSPKWFELLEKIISDYDINNEIVDLLIYSIIHQFSPKSLLLLSRLFKFERARYYFLIVINYYMLHPQSIKVAELEQSISILDSYSASNTQIASAKKMLDKLIRLKNDS